MSYPKPGTRSSVQFLRCCTYNSNATVNEGRRDCDLPVNPLGVAGGPANENDYSQRVKELFGKFMPEIKEGRYIIIVSSETACWARVVELKKPPKPEVEFKVVAP